ncbi:MAG TPA: DUF4215 domain-containing protein [Kofleriaceae bacterium]
MCGNGVIDGTEQCDDGMANGTPNARCTTQCIWTCIDDSWCADTETCNGAETCVDHACVAGTDLADGASCGTAKLCRAGVCTDAVCGDQFVTAPNEECDDANSTAGDGCESNCKYSCLSTDTARNCTPTDPCQGQGTCNDSTHVCAAGTPLNDNASCGTGKYCKTGVCTTAVCGNGMTEPGEQCDLGTSNGTIGSGCKANCTYECVTAATDCAAAPACNIATCTTAHACDNVPDPTKNGMSCGGTNICSNGACVAPTAVCGNGVTEGGEQCDFGASNGAGTGCETNCLFSCTITPTDSCTDGNLCNGTESCGAVTVNGKPGQKCSATAAPAAGTTCAAGKICFNQLCVTSVCGDGIVSTANGEQCEPPNTATCSATCQNIVCGDGVRAGTEQCDDGNTTNLDGCDGVCKFEQCHRVNTLSMSFTTDTYCTKNALGGAIVGQAQGQIGTALTNGVNDGSITIDFKALGLDDLNGTTDPAFSLGVLTGAPVAGTGYNGASDLDWWYTTAATVIDAMRNPITTLAGSIASKTINAGPGDIAVTISLAGVPATLNMLRAKLTGSVGATSKPLVSTGNTPGHLASEHLDSALVSFATVTGGKLCGDVTAKSLTSVPVPMALQGCASIFNLTACNECYTASNNLLDVLVSGCKNPFVGQLINATQPDAARVIGDVYTFTANTSHVVNACKKNGATATLSTCLDDAAYSSFFKFTTDRVIAK